MTPKLEPEPQIIKTTIRVPKALWNKTRIYAIEHETSAEALLVKALEAFFKKGGN